MNTREPERLFYVELAKQQARVSRHLSGSELPRFTKLAASGGIEDPAVVELSFAADDQGRVQVTGYAEVTAPLVCHRCSETLLRTVRVPVSVCLISDEHLATELGSDRDVLVTQGARVTVAEIVEDELILGLPERLCDSEPCELTPAFHYPAGSGDDAGGKDAGEEIDERDVEANPFSVLASLKKQQRDL